jgi:hypothetical protein
MCGLKDHDCRARMQARQGRVEATRQQALAGLTGVKSTTVSRVS